MKKTFLYILLSIVCATITAQTPSNVVTGPGSVKITEGAKLGTTKKAKKAKKPKKAKKYADPIHIKDFSDIRFFVPQKITFQDIEDDTVVFSTNFKDTTLRTYRGKDYNVVYKLACTECFRIDSLKLDTNTVERFASSKFRFYIQAEALIIPRQNVPQYNRASDELDPYVIKQRKIIEDANSEIRKYKEISKKTKTGL